MLDWTRAKLDRPGVGDTGGSFEPYRELLAALDRYEKFAKDSPDDRGLVDTLREVVRNADRQLAEYPTEPRNAAVTTVRGAAYNEVERVLRAVVAHADQQLAIAPTYYTAEAVLFAADEYLREFGAAPNAHQVVGMQQAAMQYKRGNNQLLNTGYAVEHNLSTDRTYYTKPRPAVPADVNCALCTAAAVVTSLTGTLVTTDAVVRRLHPNPVLSAPATTGLGSLDYAMLYQHPETFTQLGRTLQGGSSMADLSKTVAVNVRAADGIKRAAQLYGVSTLGAQAWSGRVGEAKQEMTLPRYRDCVFAVLVESAGHWNLARRFRGGVMFVDYQTDRADKQGPQTGTNPQMGVKPTAQQRDLGDQHNVTFLAFTR